MRLPGPALSAAGPDESSSGFLHVYPKYKAEQAGTCILNPGWLRIASWMKQLPVRTSVRRGSSRNQPGEQTPGAWPSKGSVLATAQPAVCAPAAV